MISVATMFNWAVSATANYISLTPPLIEEIGETSNTHIFINRQSLEILINDGYKKEAQLFQMFASQLDNGVIWIDKGLKSTCHYYNPDTGTGMWLWPSAAEKCSMLFDKSLKLWQNKKHAMAMFFLGAAIHLVQDVCVPHHASCKILGGHLDFEGWVEKRKEHFSVESGGLYNISPKIIDWIAENARLAKNYYNMVSNNSPEGYNQATEVLLPQAQRSTAGFLLHFYNQTVS